MLSLALKGMKDRSKSRRLLAFSTIVVLLAALGVSELASAAPFPVYTHTLITVSDRIGIRTDTPDANTVLDATRSGADTYIKSRNPSLGAYFQTQSGVLWAGYNMLNASGQTATFFGYRGSTQFRVFDGLASQDRILMDAAGTSNGNIYLNPSNSGSVGIGTMSPFATLDVVTSSGDAVAGYTGSPSGWYVGVRGETVSSGGDGVFGYASSTSGDAWGVDGVSESSSGVGVAGYAAAPTGNTIGVWGETASEDGFGVYAYAPGLGTAVYGENPDPSGWAGYFLGDVHVDGTLTKAAGGFRIDHPLDPENMYLNHSFVESADMKDIYDGVVTLDEGGQAWVQLPEWFQALNQDFRYQLTPIGAAMPDLHIAEEIQDNRFMIAGGAPGMKISWLVTGIRHDPYAEAHRIPVEEEKPAGDRGAPGLSPRLSQLGLKHRDVTSR